ncbi:MAG: hypothetical protein R3236_04950 [Phycisphaeraceae bacterium]|nr:hypothetical protein [Phycisphaeraceae bacterium]
MEKDLGQLSVDDAKAMDALVDCGFDLEAVPDEHRQRAERLMQLLGLLEELPGHDGGDGELIVQRTMAAVRRDRAAMEQQATRPMRRIGLPVRELAAVLAILIVGGTLLWPLMRHNRMVAQRRTCAAHLQEVAQGLALYAETYQGVLPSHKAKPGAHWNRLNRFAEDGTALSNSAHLFVGVWTRHIDPSTLVCPGNEHEVNLTKHSMDWPSSRARHLSYQNQYRSGGMHLASAADVAILADANPLFARGHEAPPTANSPNHGGRGQNVLMGNGVVSWLNTPRLENGDLIYHAGREVHQNYEGTELPTDDQDAFLVP